MLEAKLILLMKLQLLPLFIFPFTYTVISGHLSTRPITHTGRLLHMVKKKVNRLPAWVDNPHVMLLNFLVAKT